MQLSILITCNSGLYALDILSEFALDFFEIQQLS